jgi:PIN domain
MTAHKGLVLDANILLRAVFGQRVRQILEAYEDQANFYAPDVCFQDARKYRPFHAATVRCRSGAVCAGANQSHR